MARQTGSPTDLFQPRAPFQTGELALLRASYLRSPVDLSCPQCRPGRMEVVDFVEPEPDRKGFAIPAEPRGVYVVLLRCLGCCRAGAVLVEAED